MLAAPLCYYLIISQLNSMALEVDISHGMLGAPISPQTKKNTVSQQWVDHPETGTIRSKLNPNFCMDIMGGRLVLNRYDKGKPDQEWARNGSLITSLFEHHMVLDIFGNNKTAGAKVVKHKGNGGVNQAWIFQLV